MASALFKLALDDEYPEAPEEVRECPLCLDRYGTLSLDSCSRILYKSEISEYSWISWTFELFWDSVEFVRIGSGPLALFPDMNGLPAAPVSCSNDAVIRRMELSLRWFDFSYPVKTWRYSNGGFPGW